MSHDQINRFLRTSKRPVNELRALVAPLLRDSSETFLLVDDRVQDKRYSRFIDLAKRQYAGNAHGMVTGIGLVNLVHSSGETGDFLPLYQPHLRPRRRGTDEKRPFPGHV